MPLEAVLIWSVITIASIAVGSYVVHGAWSAIGAWRIRRAGPRPLAVVKHALWRDPGDVQALDLTHGPGGRDLLPSPPYRFVEEHASGTNPCVTVTDARGRRWRVKWGPEVNSETFAVRIAWACGYFAEVTHYVTDGSIRHVKALQRAASCVDEAGRFTAARFELDDPTITKLFEEHSWSWSDNPFVGTRELQGLKILAMLLSNWDTKDRRDVARGSNTAIFEHPFRHGREARYLITDWGGAMGRWGNAITRGRWDPAAYETQTAEFITAVEDGVVKFGYSGQRTEDIAVGITPDDVGWFVRYASRLTDRQLSDALTASGASEEERAQFLRALRERIDQLLRASSSA
jgi:hypothetical protein